MATGDQEFLAFNRGLVSRFALARTDLAKLKLAAQRFVNWMPRALGAMSLRVGLGYKGATASNAQARLLPFVFSSSDVAKLEITNTLVRVWVDDALVTRGSVSTVFANGTFDSNLTSWTGVDEGSAVSDWATGGYMSLIGTGSGAAIRRQTLTVSGGDQNAEHALRVIVERGPVTLRVGSTSGGAEYIRDYVLGKGAHSLTFTPTGANVYVQIFNRETYAALVDSIAIEAAGVMTLPAPWLTADLRLIRFDQSGDVVYLACSGYQQRKIERRSTRSWSVVVYQPIDGPFLTANTSPTTLTATAITGNTTLTASTPVFRSTHVGALFQHTSVGQLVSASLTGAAQSTGNIEVNGVGAARTFSISITGTWTATIVLERSMAAPGSWTTVATYTINQSTSLTDGLDNQVAFYRLTCSAFTSGTAVAQLSYSAGSITGVARVTAYTSETVVSVEVLIDLGGTAATDDWAEGQWSDFRGWPSAVAFDGGRLWWSGKDKFNGSISDAFEGFDPNYEGDAAPISRSVGSGPVDAINWLVSMQRLLAGTDGAVVSVRSSSLDEPLTNANFNPKQPSTQGSAQISAVKIDSALVYVQRSGVRLYSMDFSIETNDYRPNDLTAVVPEIGSPGFVTIAVQRQPDTRIHCVRSDGTVAILVFDAAEDVKCWIEFETDGEVEEVCVTPGTEEDAVYYVVKRTVNGSTVRFIEKWALLSECVGGSLNKQADSFITYTGGAVSSLAVAHLEGETLVRWCDGEDKGTAVVTGGSIALGGSYTNVMVGLPYTAQWQSAKLAYIIERGFSGLTKRKRIESIGVILVDTHPQGLSYGRDFNNLDALPQSVGYQDQDQDTMIEEWDHQPVAFPGEFTADSRLCLQAAAPRPCTVLAAVIQQQSNT